MSEPAEGLTDAFTAMYGRPPDRVWRAPGRVNVIGEHTDYNDGLALPIALPVATTAAVARRADGRLVIRSRQRPEETTEAALDDLRPGSVRGWAAYAAGIAWSLGAAGHPVPGADVLVDGQVPQGSGLSSSAALECAVGMALVDLGDMDDLLAARSEVARLAQRAENEFVGAPTGIMDQMASLLAEERHALLLDARDLSTRAVPFDLAGEGLALLVVDTGTSHDHVSSEYAERRRACERAAAALHVGALRDVTEADLDGPAVAGLDAVTRRRVRHVVTENARVLGTVGLLDAGRVREIGPMLTASHASLRDDFQVSAPALDAAVDGALDAGAYGARMTGGGFGGSAIALADADRIETVRAAIERVYADRDFGPATFHTVVPAAGAQRLR